MKSPSFPDGVSELQGMYGPLQILESKVQQIWAFQQFQSGDWRTRTGSHLKILDAGRWNRGAGPDFLDAVIELDGEARVGDVEIHLYREDWWRHGHDSDPAYQSVILHAVLFAGGMERVVRTSNGRVPEEWIMGPHTREDIESISGGSPGLFGELVPELREWMEGDSPSRVRVRLKAGADRRWQDKESMARGLYDSHGWEGALHRMCLYYLGFPYNRRHFYEMAENLPPSRWSSSPVLPFIKDRWAERVKWHLGRPANRAERRLKEYIRLSHTGDWMSRLMRPPAALTQLLGQEIDNLWGPSSTGEVRKRARLPDWRLWLGRSVLANQLNKVLVDRLWSDVFLPLLVVGGFLRREDAFALWFHWWPSAYPECYRELLKLAAIQADRSYPLCNGWVQGILWLEDQLRLERIRRSLGRSTRSADPKRCLT